MYRYEGFTKEQAEKMMELNGLNANEAKRLTGLKSIPLNSILEKILEEAKAGKTELLFTSGDFISDNDQTELTKRGFEVSFTRPMYERERVWTISWLD